MTRIGRFAVRGLVVAVGAVLTLSACGAGERDPSTPAPNGGDAASPTDGAATTSNGNGGAVPDRDLPRLVALSTRFGNTYSSVELRFEPGRGQPTASIAESNDSTVRRPGSGRPVELAGDQALRVTVSPAVVGDVRPLRPGGPRITEVRVLGSFEGHVAIGIGIEGAGDLEPKVSYDEDEHTISIAVPNAPVPPEDPDLRRCGDVQLGRESAASNIVAVGVGCDVARDVAAIAEGQVGDPYDTPSGFSCLIDDRDQQPVPTVDYVCRRGEATITFIAS